MPTSPPSVTDSETIPLYLRLGLRGTRDAEGWVRVEPHPAICSHGVIRSSVLVLMVDMMAGFIAEADAAGDWHFTTDLSLRMQPVPTAGPLVARGKPLRVGRRTSSAEVSIADAAGVEVAYGQAGFSRAPRRHGDPPQPHVNAQPLQHIPPLIETPVLEAGGFRVVDPAAGRVEVELDARLLNPAGVMQGAMVTLVAEAAGEALARHAWNAPAVVTDMDVRYLAMGREGPIHSEAAWIGPAEDGRVRAALYDAGNRDRLVATVLLRVERLRAA